MMRSVIILFILFLSGKVNAQGNSFALSTSEKQSFYDKRIVEIINKQLKKYHRSEGDTVIVEINDFSEATFFDAFIVIKKKKQLKYYYVFYNPQIEYYIVRLNETKLPMISIKNI